MITIMLAEDHPIVRNGIKMLLDTQDNMRVIGEANNGREVLELLESGVMPDILMTDISMPEMDGVALTEVIAERFPAVKVIVLSMLNSTQNVAQAFHAGAQGYLVKNISYDEMLFAIQHIHRGRRYLCEELSMLLLDKLYKQSDLHAQSDKLIQEVDLSDRELEILQLIGEGFTNMEIADRLFLSKRTVEGHRQNLIDKTGARNSPELIKFAVKNGLIT
ncbi:MAG TPA: response regulator transcription factor [Sphingobacteriaceae bacterium]|nr:response regulator transcription factor [Sphingobacteriaceae bacterium]